MAEVEKLKRGIKELQLDMSCSFHCESCEKFFKCKSPEKLKIFERRRMSRVLKVMSKIKHKVAICAGKGGVGKSLFTTNFSTVLAARGHKVAILDQDLDGPCIPKMLGLTKEKMFMGDYGIVPVKGIYDMKIVSLGFVTTEAEIVNWFQEKRRNATEEFLSHVDYGELDFLNIDLPPGTSSDAVNLMEYIPDLDGMVVVTNPTRISQIVARRATIMAIEAGVNMLGIVENMSGFVCPDCGEEVDIMEKGGGEDAGRRVGGPFFRPYSLGSPDQRIQRHRDSLCGQLSGQPGIETNRGHHGPDYRKHRRISQSTKGLNRVELFLRRGIP